MTDRYSFSLTTFSPSGKLGQIEYAFKAISEGDTSVGVKATNGVVIATHKKPSSNLVDITTMERITQVCPNIGLVFSGMQADARVLASAAQKAAQGYKAKYGEYPPTVTLVRELAKTMQQFTQSGGVRPFGVSLLVAGFDSSNSTLYQVDPSGAYFAWKATAMGKNKQSANAFLDRRYNEEMELEDAVQTAIITLRENFDGQLTADMIEIGVVQGASDFVASGLPNLHPSVCCPRFRKLDTAEIQDYLATI